MSDLQEYLGNDYKVYVDVNVDHLADGTILPRYFFWEDGRRYDVDRILDIRPAASLKAGGLGLRYTARVMNKKIFLYLEEDHGACRWFLERK